MEFSTDADEFMDRHAAARILGCSPNTITRLILTGRIKAGDVGTGLNKHYRIMRSELRSYQEETLAATAPKRRGRNRKPAAPPALA